MRNPKWPERRPPEDFLRVLDPGGTLIGEPPACSDDEFMRWYQILVETRTLEALTVRMQRRGELSVAGTSEGEEAVGVGAAAALQAGDWCFPSYRQTSALLHWNAPIDHMIAGLMGAPPEHIRTHLPVAEELTPGIHFAPYTIFLGASIPHAVGSALADQLNGRRTVTLAFLGDGATSEGDFYEGANFAGVFAAPIVIVIQNNQWSISVPAHRQTAARTFADKAVAVGLRQFRVDGNDIFAVYQSTKEAVDHARAGAGPSLIEAVTYRVGDHNTSDSAAGYRGDLEVRYWQARDPLDRLGRYLERKGLLDDVEKRRVAANADQKVRAAIARARTVPPAPAALMFANHLIEKTGWSVRRQQLELDRELDAQNPFAEYESGQP